MSTTRLRLGSILIRQGVITQDDLEQAVLYQLRSESMAGRTLLAGVRGSEGGSRPLRLGEALVALGLCGEDDIARALAEQLEIPFIDLRADPPDARAMARVPAETARRLQFVPVREEAGWLLAAPLDPTDPGIRAAIEEAVGGPVALAMAPESQVRELLEHYERAQDAAAEGAKTVVFALTPPEPQAVLYRFVAEAVRRRASDLYFEPVPDGVRVQYRIDGRLYPAATLEATILPAVTAHVRIMCGLEQAGEEEALDGHWRLRVDRQPVSLHATTLPGEHGNTMLLRILPGAAI